MTIPAPVPASADAPFDVVVIGFGPGGYVAAIRAAQLGLRVAVVERDERVGGTCLLRGCIPTKALLHTADLYQDFQNRHEFGILADNLSVDFSALMARKDRIVNRLSRGVQGYQFRKNRITLFKGQGRLDGPGRVVIEGEGGFTTIATTHIMLATGSRPRSLPGLALDGRRIMTSDDILELKEMPKSLLIIGAGAVGVEFGSIFGRFGTRVAVIEMLPRILPLEDEEISREAEKQLSRHMTIFTGTRTESATTGADSVSVVVTLASGEKKTLEAERLLVSIGRAPVSDGLGLETTRVRLERGFVRVGPLLETGEAGIHAIGDLITVEGAPHPQLAHVASAEGILVAEKLAGRAVAPIDYDRVPGATYCNPEVASIGLSEAEARKRGHDVMVGRFTFGNLAKPRILGHDAGFIKVVSDKKDDQILGLHLIGPRATLLLSEACVAFRLGATIEDLARTIHPHPTLSEALMQAAESVYGMAIDA
jgi:dihydrolipoamide dehydrogenase